MPPLSAGTIRVASRSTRRLDFCPSSAPLQRTGCERGAKGLCAAPYRPSSRVPSSPICAPGLAAAKQVAVPCWHMMTYVRR